jgi:hypothetical protein
MPKHALSAGCWKEKGRADSAALLEVLLLI